MWFWKLYFTDSSSLYIYLEFLYVQSKGKKPVLDRIGYEKEINIWWGKSEALKPVSNFLACPLWGN